MSMLPSAPSSAPGTPVPQAACSLPPTSGALSRLQPRTVLLGSQCATVALPVCDHYSGVPERMRKSLQLQAELMSQYGACVMDVTLDCEDGAPAGDEVSHAALVADLVLGAASNARVAVRVHPIDHHAFANDIECIVGKAGHRLCHIMLPKVEAVDDVVFALKAIDAVGAAHLPVHALIESPTAVHNAFAIAAHPRVQSLSFGLMDFVSAHRGAVPASAMDSTGQFSHPLVVRAKLEIAAASHAHGKVPSHCVVTEFLDTNRLRSAAQRAAQELGYTRMWSIHPAQIRPILEAFAPAPQELEMATRLLLLAAAAQWAPVSLDGVLHDRASYRYFWYVLERAYRTGAALAPDVLHWFDTSPPNFSKPFNKDAP